MASRTIAGAGIDRPDRHTDGLLLSYTTPVIIIGSRPPSLPYLRSAIVLTSSKTA